MADRMSKLLQTIPDAPVDPAGGAAPAPQGGQDIRSGLQEIMNDDDTQKTPQENAADINFVAFVLSVIIDNMTQIGMAVEKLIVEHENMRADVSAAAGGAPEYNVPGGSIPMGGGAPAPEVPPQAPPMPPQGV